MKCPQCGVESPDRVKFCPECGLSLQPRSAAIPRADSTGFPGGEAATFVGLPSDGSDAGTFLGLQSDGESDLLPDDSMTLGVPGGGRSGFSRNFFAPPSSPANVTVGTPPLPAGTASGVGPATSGAEPPSDQGPLSVGQQFGRYSIIRLLGLGGMGAVYQAWDEELEVAVALKVIRPEVTADPTAAQELERRFKRELLLARQVTHRNVVRIHDLGEREGIKYITMTYVRGTDLGTAVSPAGRLSVPRLLKILRSVVSGLVAAHEAGVVHRDLKPENIMLEEKSDEPLIMDFGIARSSIADQRRAEAAEATGGDVWSVKPSTLTNATVAGSVLGTVAYMAPEQARAQEVDERADIYSLGLICYDLLVGTDRRKSAARPLEELRQRLEQAPPSPRSLNPDIPEPVDALVMRCVQPDPAARFQTTTELAAALARLDENGLPLPVQPNVTKRLVALVVLGLAVTTGGTYWLNRPVPPKPAPPLTTVLVADFADRTGSPVFKGTLEQALTTGVEGASFITAYPRPSAQRLAGELKPGSRLDADMARLVASREGVKVVLAGTVDPSAGGYALKVDAIDAAAGKVLATATANATSPERVLSAMSTVANRLRGALGDTAPDARRGEGAEAVTASSLQALQAYARAQDLQAAREDQKALEAYQQAIQLDPKFGRAYAGMGVVYWNLRDDVKAKAAYDKALQLVGRMTDREKYRTLGTYYMFIARNYEKAIENYETLVRLFPADDAGHGNLSIAYLFTGNLKGAVEQVRKVLELNPRSTSDRYNYAMYSLYAGDLEAAVREGGLVAKESPAFPPGGLLPVALANVLAGNREGAGAAYAQLEKASPSGLSLGRFGRADLQMYHGQYHEALTILEEGIAADGKAGDSGAVARDLVAAAESYLALGQRPRAVDCARKAAKLSDNESVLVPAALVLIAAGRGDDAEKLALTLEKMLQTHMTAYARLILGEAAAQRGRYAEAIELFRDSIKRRDTWLARFLLGRLYARIEHFPEAMAELDACFKRRGEAADVFFYDTPTARYLPSAIYWFARSQQALGVAGFDKLYRQFLDIRGEAAPADPLAVDARTRLAQPR